MTAATRSIVRRSVANGTGRSVDFARVFRTIEWYRAHQDWMREIKDASYLSYYDRMYTRRDDTLDTLLK